MQTNLKEKHKSLNISLTAYRAIKILKILIEKPCSQKEIIDYLKSDELTCRSISDDTLRITINSLKNVGCIISRPCRSNSYKYVLQKHPFGIKFTTNEIKILYQIREQFLQQSNWKFVMELNNLYDNIFCEDENEKDLINKNRPFSKIKEKILEDLKQNRLEKKSILMTYQTSINKVGIIDIVTERIFCENRKLYLMAWYPKRKKFAYFNLEKIQTIHSIKPYKKDKNSPQIALYKVLGDEVLTFKCNSDEKIIKRTSEYIIVETIVESEFKFFQRILSFGVNFSLIEPDYLKVALKNKINKIKERYT
jgi:hypothetical protein